MASMRVLPCLTATVLRSSASRTSRSASSRCDCFDMLRFSSWVAPRSYMRLPQSAMRLCGLFAHQRLTPAVARGEGARPHASVELRFASRRAIGVQIRRAAGRDALEKCLRAGRRDGANAGIALRGGIARAGSGKDSSQHDPATLEHGRKPLAFFAIMRCEYD